MGSCTRMARRQAVLREGFSRGTSQQGCSHSRALQGAAHSLTPPPHQAPGLLSHPRCSQALT